MIYQNPSANKKPLSKKEIESGLMAYTCQESEGLYIPFENYWKWLSKQDTPSPNIPEMEMVSKVNPSQQTPKFCPETRTLMPSYEVGHGFKFRINRSVTGGIWFDKGEWEELRSRNFHDEIHLIFSEPWQKNIREQKLSDAYTEEIKKRLGPSLFDQVTDLKNLLQDHNERDAVLAYLNSDI